MLLFHTRSLIFQGRKTFGQQQETMRCYLIKSNNTNETKFIEKRKKSKKLRLLERNQIGTRLDQKKFQSNSKLFKLLCTPASSFVAVIYRWTFLKNCVFFFSDRYRLLLYCEVPDVNKLLKDLSIRGMIQSRIVVIVKCNWCLMCLPTRNQWNELDPPRLKNQRPPLANQAGTKRIQK